MTTSTRARSPRLTRKGQATRQRIIEVAARLMFEQGMALTTLEQVREAANVSGSQVYHYFADKQALVRAVIDHQSEIILRMQQPRLARLDSLSGLRAWRDMIVDHQVQLECRGGCPLGALGAEVAESDSHARKLVAAGFDRWEEGIRAGLHTMHTRGDLPAGTSPDDLALALLSALQGGLLLTQVQRRIRPLEVALDTVLEHIATLVALPDTA